MNLASDFHTAIREAVSQLAVVRDEIAEQQGPRGGVLVDLAGAADTVADLKSALISKRRESFRLMAAIDALRHRRGETQAPGACGAR